MRQRLKLVVAYEGTPFAGWQSQHHGRTVQDELEKALAQITERHIRVHGAGRTDTGVHALAQTAHIDLTTSRFPPPRLQTALNGLLPSSIRIMRCQRVAGNFHSRFDAIGKIYRYRVWNGAVLPPLEHGRAWHVTDPLDLEAMRAALTKFKGRHDFAAFAANRGERTDDTVRTISTARLSRRGPCLTMEFEGDGFLYKMVRLMAGTIVQCGRHKSPVSDIAQRLQNRQANGPRLVAPAAGLFLVRVRY